MESSVARIVAAVVAGGRSPEAVLREHVERYRETASVNALVQPRHDAAAVEARAIAAALEQGGADEPGRLPLAGVPVSVKECFPVAGLVTSLGIPSRCGVHDQADAEIVARLKSAGALVVGKCNVSQAMYLHEADNPVWGRTNHPLDSRRGPGGSSGGDAALVAAGVVPLAVGTDLAGSIRQPAHACGIAGLVPRQAVAGEGGAVDTVPHLETVRPRVGFLARHVDDLELALGVLCRDAGTVSRVPAKAAPLRIAWWDDAGVLEPSAVIRRAVHEAVNRLERAGAVTVQVSGELAAEAAWLHLAILSADGGADIRRLFGGTRPIPPVAKLLAIAGCPGWLRAVMAAGADLAGCRIEARALRATGPRTPAALAALFDRRAALAVRCAELLAGCDAVVCPVSALPALPHGTASKLVVAAAPCMLANLLDLAAGAVPVTRVRPEEEDRAALPSGRDRVVRAAVEADRGSRGLPVGVQVIGLGPVDASTDGPLAAERTVLDVMRLIEAGNGDGARSFGCTSGAG